MKVKQRVGEATNIFIANQVFFISLIIFSQVPWNNYFHLETNLLTFLMIKFGAAGRGFHIIRRVSTIVVPFTQNTIPSDKPLSKRAMFKLIPIDMHIINKLDTLDLGFLAKRRRRISVAIKRRAMTGKSKLLCLLIFFMDTFTCFCRSGVRV